MEIFDLLQNHQSPIDLSSHLKEYKLFVSTGHLFIQVGSIEEAIEVSIENKLILPQIKIRGYLFDILVLTTTIGSVTEEGDFISTTEIHKDTDIKLGWLTELNQKNKNLDALLTKYEVTDIDKTSLCRGTMLHEESVINLLSTIMLKKFIDVI